MTIALYGSTGAIPLPRSEPPLTHDLNAGESFGLEYSDLAGYRPERGYWAVWDRHTGQVIAMAWPEPTGHQWDHMKYRVRRMAEPLRYGDNFNPAIYDAVS